MMCNVIMTLYDAAVERGTGSISFKLQENEDMQSKKPEQVGFIGHLKDLESS